MQDFMRVILAFIVAAGAVMLIAPFFIPMLHRLKYGQVEREEGPHAHSAKMPSSLHHSPKNETSVPHRNK